jgi:murein DD-endopeptidase MepM/ murein hydrolase activator NlpD
MAAGTDSQGTARKPATLLLALAVLAAVSALAALAAAPAAGRREHGQIFPIRGPHWDRGPVGEFGAPRTGGRTHIGFDFMSPCGTELVSARGGTVLKRAYSAELDGNYVVIHARGLGRNYWYSHLRKPAIVDEGEIVETGQRIGSVGKSGNAVSVGCHLHFEIHVHGDVIDPEPALRRWDSWS